MMRLVTFMIAAALLSTIKAIVFLAKYRSVDSFAKESASKSESHS